MSQTVTKNQTTGVDTTTPSSSKAPVSDVSESMRELRNRTPQESLRMGSDGGLLMPFLLATLICAVLFFGWTGLAYVSDKNSPSGDKAEKKSPSGTKETVNTPPTQTNPDGQKGPELTAPPRTVVKKDIVDALKENDTKKANPKVNPLERKEDDFFKDIKPN